jgi:hypothetical protein
MLVVILALALLLVFVGTAAAHETPDNAPDTPLPNASANAVDNYVDALSHSEAENSLFRNPTCDAHNIHPPGNP